MLLGSFPLLPSIWIRAAMPPLSAAGERSRPAGALVHSLTASGTSHSLRRRSQQFPPPLGFQGMMTWRRNLARQRTISPRLSERFPRGTVDGDVGDRLSDQRHLNRTVASPDPLLAPRTRPSRRPHCHPERSPSHHDPSRRFPAATRGRRLDCLVQPTRG